MLDVVEAIAVAARRDAAVPALITGNRTIAFGELLDMVARISNHLARNLPPRAKLFLNIADPDLRLIVTIAAMHAGFSPFVLLDIGDLAGQVDYDFVIGAALPHLPNLVCDVTIDQAVLRGKLSDPTLQAFPEPPEDAIALIASTTGSTGRPKLVAFTHGCLRARNRIHGLVPGERYEGPAPWPQPRPRERIMATFGDVTYAGFAAAIQVLLIGLTNVRASRDWAETLALINRYGVDRLATTPGILSVLMDRMDESGTACPSIGNIVFAGSSVDETLAARVRERFGRDVVIGMTYGATEAGLISGGVIDPDAFEPGYVGDVFPGVRLVASDSPAEPARFALVRNPATHAPYYADGGVVRSDETFYTLPDIGYVRGNRVYFVGRDDEVLNISGNTVAYSVIDAALRAMPGVKDVAVVGGGGIGDPSGIIVGIVGDADLAGLARRVAEIVTAPDTARHVHLFSLAEIPHNAFGKTDRTRLTAAFIHHATSRQQRPAGTA